MLFAAQAARRGFVDNRPERSHLFDGVHQLVEVHRFDDVGIHPQCVAAEHIALFARGSHDDDRNELQLRVGFDLAQLEIGPGGHIGIAAGPRLCDVRHAPQLGGGDDAPGKTPPPVKPKRAGEGRKRGKQPGAPGSHLEFRGKADVYENRFPEGACGCGADLKAATDLGVVDSYQQTDIPEVTVTVTQHDMHKVACGCGRVHTATRPDGARQGRVGYGPNLQAFAVYLMVVQHIPVQRCVALLEG